MKPGIKSTEFWVSQIVNVLSIAGIMAGMLPPEIGATVIGVVQSTYNIARGVAKRGGA